MVFFSLSATVLGQGLTAAIDTSGSTFLWIALLAGLLGLVFALFLARSVLAFDTGTPEMRLISNAIREGAEAFMSRQYTTIAALAVVLAVALFVGYRFSDFTAPMAGKVVISFLIGACCSGFAGYTGMFVSIRTNIRAASAARASLGRALKIALHGGAVTGMVVISLSLLGVGSLFYFFGGLTGPAARSLSAGRLWLWRFAGGALRPTRRWHLHQGCRRGRRPGGQGGGRHPGRRSAQSRR